MRNIVIKGAKSHNLKNIDLTIPRDKLIVITGLSGSGKSSLAFDTIFAEGQRRYVESLSAYARQFLARMERPDVDSIDGLSPAISIDQKVATHNPRSTVGTVTEIYDYFRLLFASVGDVFCHGCGVQIESMSVQEILERAMLWGANKKILIMARIDFKKYASVTDGLAQLKQKGFVRLFVNGDVLRLDDVCENHFKSTT